MKTKGEEQMARHQEDIVHQLENYRETISGVSLEEEAVNMMQFQAVFNATAKALKSLFFINPQFLSIIVLFAS